MGNHIVLVRGEADRQEVFKQIIRSIHIVTTKEELQGCKCSGTVGISPRLREVKLYDISMPDSMRDMVERNFLDKLNNELPFKIPRFLYKFINGMEPFDWQRPATKNAIGQDGLLNTGVHVLGWKKDALGDSWKQKCLDCKEEMKQVLL